MSLPLQPTHHTPDAASARPWGHVSACDRSVLGWGLTWSGLGHVAAVIGLIAWAMSLPEEPSHQRPLAPVPHVDRPMNVQFVMNKGESLVPATAPAPEPEKAQPVETPPKQVAAKKPPKKRVKKRKPRIAQKQDLVNHRAIAPPVVDAEAPTPSPIEDQTEETQVAQIPAAPSSPAPDLPAAGEKGNVGQTANVDRRGALRGYLRKINRQIQREYTYPRSAQRAKLEGRAVVKITIDAKGLVIGVELAETSGHSVLDDAALSAARGLLQLPAAPAELQWTERSVRVPFRYSLTG